MVFSALQPRSLVLLINVELPSWSQFGLRNTWTPVFATATSPQSLAVWNYGIAVGSEAGPRSIDNLANKIFFIFQACLLRQSLSPITNLLSIVLCCSEKVAAFLGISQQALPLLLQVLPPCSDAEAPPVIRSVSSHFLLLSLLPFYSVLSPASIVVYS